ncbi:SIR2 family NAD-dependent protein deacylase [Bacillus cereus]
MDVNLEKLRKDYQDDKIVPFIGAGLSVPFNVPNWKMLINNITEKYVAQEKAFIKEVVKEELRNNDYWGAIDALMKYVPMIDQDIQEEVVEIIKEKQTKLHDDSLHNYSDIGEMNFKLHLTTNYENLLDDYLKCDNRPILLKDIQFSTQRLFDEKRVCHLHGFTSNSGTIVLSRESYSNLYMENKYENLLKVVTGNKKLLFMGFSFDDQFVSTLIKDHKKYFNGTHYILLDNPTSEKVRELRTKYGLLTIPYQSESSSHTEEIRKILKYISEPITVEVGNANSNVSSGETASPIIIGAGLNDMDQNVENNLFYKKLKLENIDPLMIKLSSIFYISAEIYIRELRKVGISIEVIDAMLGKVFVKYMERYADTYNRYGDSQKFLEVVHKSLEGIEFGRYAELFKGNKSDENENRGLIHILAEEEGKGSMVGRSTFK